MPMKTCTGCSKEINIGCKKCPHCDINIGKGPKKTIVKKPKSTTAPKMPMKTCPKCNKESWPAVRICPCKHEFRAKKEPKAPPSWKKPAGEPAGGRGRPKKTEA
eukprot:CAMPEP_0173085100 /NCGR_PEP_ID=MMETSP1102-20130122/21250_1 /TAXON_ID=49646 /ORGANISM="Geminigera sp., Strain Caron Lab Isolate" /LENGTH=103 /DNA_ID=CAMNT_0013963973 /DNA_START=14 /DNA_END=325 /DNA_ORIENTATION=+